MKLSILSYHRNKLAAGGMPWDREAFTLHWQYLVLATIFGPHDVTSHAAAQGWRFHLEEATIADVHRAIRAKQITATQLVNLYFKRIEAYNGTCVKGEVDPATGLMLGDLTADRECRADQCLHDAQHPRQALANRQGRQRSENVGRAWKSREPRTNTSRAPGN